MAKANNGLFKRTAKKQSEEVEPISLQLMNQPPPDDVKPLNVTERRRLAELENLITRNFKAFYEVGCALREIQDKQLYRMTHSTFADYAADLWDMARRTAYQYIGAADVVDNVRHGAQIPFENVHNCGQNFPLPQNERQARALFKYSPENQVALWRAAVESAENGRITAAHIRRTARGIKLEKEQKTLRKTQEAAPKIRMSEEFRAAYTAFLAAIDDERMTDYKHTDMDEVLKALEILTAAIRVEL